MSDTGSFLAFVGTYGDAGNENLYSYRVDSETGELTRLDAVRAGKNPSFLTVHPDGEHLYAVNEADEGEVVAVSIDRRTGELSLVDRRSSGDAGPCHCSIDATGSYLLVAHYVGGSVSLLPIREDGGLDTVTQVVEHEGSSIHPERQTRPHPHSIAPGPENRTVYVPDLGADRLFVYTLNLDEGTLRPTDPPHVSLHGGAGPRHFDIHPDGRVLYLLNELDATLTIFGLDPATSALDKRETIQTLPDGIKEENLAADLHVHPSGRWVYASNRGHDSIAIIDLDDGGHPTGVIGHESTRGSCPRNFAIDPSGTCLFAENKKTNNIVAFRIDRSTGELTFTGHQSDIPRPSCMEIIASKAPE